MSEDWKGYIFDEDGRDKISFLIEQLQEADNKIEALEKYITNCTSAEIFFTDNTIKLKELEQKLEQKIALSPKTKEYYKGLEYRINELEEKLDSHIDDFQLALRKIIYEHINTQGDEYGEDIQELLRMMDGFKKKLGTEDKYKTVEWEKKDLEEDPFIDELGPKAIKEKAYIGILCPECGEEINVTESWHNQFESYENPIAKHIYKDVIKKLSKLNEKIITVESEEYNFRNQPVVHWSNIHNLIEEYKKKLKDLETISRAKKPYKCRLTGIECFFLDKKCHDCIVDKESQIGYGPETRKLIEQYKKDRETTDLRSNNHTEEIPKK